MFVLICVKCEVFYSEQTLGSFHQQLGLYKCCTEVPVLFIFLLRKWNYFLSLHLFLFYKQNTAAVDETLRGELRSSEHQREYSSHPFWPKPLMSSRLTGTNSMRSSAAQQMAFQQRSRSHDWDPGLSYAKVCQCRAGFHTPGNLTCGEETYRFLKCQDLSVLVN